MFRENTLDYVKDLRCWAINMASKTLEQQDLLGTADQIADTVTILAERYLDFVGQPDVELAKSVHNKRLEYLEFLRGDLVDEALAEELKNARDALNAAKKAETEEEAERLLRAAEFSFEQVAEVKAKAVAQAAGLHQPEALAKEV